MPDYIKLLNISAENIKKTDDTALVHFSVPRSLPWFEGHFPDQPVLPAVITAEISDALIETVFAVSPQLVSNAKFKGPIFPDMALTVSLFKQSDDSIIAIWRKSDEVDREQYLADMRFRI